MSADFVPMTGWKIASRRTRAMCLEPTGICVGDDESPLKPARVTATAEQIAQWTAELQAKDAAA